MMTVIFSNGRDSEILFDTVFMFNPKSIKGCLYEVYNIEEISQAAVHN